MKDQVKQFLNLNGESSPEEYSKILFQNVVVDGYVYLKGADMRELPRYINHPNPSIRQLVRERLAKGT